MYTIGELADLAGVTRKTLRHYDKIGLLQPQSLSEAGYRLYGQEEVDLLQQILFYREMDLSLADIRALVQAPDYQVTEALNEHLAYLSQERRRIDRLIETVQTTIKAQRGEIIMLNEEKFEAFKQSLVDENEATYGEEVRKKYGDDQVDAANDRLLAVDQESWTSIEELTAILHEKLAQATVIGDVRSSLAKEVFELHKEWLTFYWPEGQYSKEMHMNMVDMYMSDERFKEYYEKIAPGATAFLQAAVKSQLI
jgi:DNA-binding transcriptional MerR regulator